MNKLRLIFTPSVIIPCLTIFLVGLLLPPAQAANPPSLVLFPVQQDEQPEERTARLGKNKGEVEEGGSEIWNYEGQAGDVLTIKAEADKPANDANPDERRQAGLLDMMLIVYAPDGTILAKADDRRPAVVTDAVIEGLVLPSDSTYKIEVLGLQKEGSGAYTLTLQADSATLSESTATIDSSWPTLTIENQLEQTICYVYIWPTSTDELGDEWLGTKEVILPVDEHQWHVAPDEYNIALNDCYGNTLDVRRQFDVTEPSTLTVSPSATDGPAALCAEGVQLFLDGKPAEALPQLSAGFAARESATFADLDDEGRCALALGILHDDLGNRTDALEAYQVALDIFQANGNRELEGTTLNNIAGVYRAIGKYDEASEQYHLALKIRQEVGNRALEGKTLNDIGLVHLELGQYELALQQYSLALEIYREVGDRQGEGAALNNIGLVYDHQARYELALEEYNQALEIARLMGERRDEGITLDNIGVAYLSQGEYELALEYSTLALEIMREVSDRAGEGDTLNNIGGIYFNQGEYELALESFKQALAVRLEMGDRAGEGDTLNNIGGVYHAQKQDKLALEHFCKALEIRREVEDRAGEGRNLSNIGKTYEQQGEAEKALVYYEQAMDVFEEVRATAGSEEGRASFIAQYADFYDRAIGLYHEQGQEEEAYQSSERGRARSFLDSLATGLVQLSDLDQQELLEREREAYAERRSAQKALARARGQNSPDAELVADLEAQLEAAEEAYSKVQADIEARGGELAALVPGRSSVPTLSEVQRLLDDQTTLLSYWVLEEEGALAFVITNNEFTVVELPKATPDNLRTARDNLYEWLSKDEPHPRSLQNLHSWLVTPLADQLKTPKVGLIPHGLLHDIPFAALTDGESYFGQQYTLFRLPSASALSHIQKNAANLLEATQPAFIFGNPATDEPGFRSLSHAAKEAASVAKLLGAPVYTDTKAHEVRLKNEISGTLLVHLAAHGTYNLDNPLYSAILLAPEGEQDGRLETHEVYGLNLSSAEMVVLSACQTNVGDVLGNDDIVGLTRAFFFAGTPTLVSSLWNVDDAATEKLMSAFYRNWQAGMGKAEALQAAQAELRETHPSPFYWAAFVLNGEPGEVSQPPSPEIPLLMIAGIAGLLAVVGLLVFGIALNKRRRNQ